MAKRSLYRLELDIDDYDSVIVYRTDNNYGRQGVVFMDDIRLEHHPREIPDYIIREARRIIKASEFELKRGYTLGGKSCVLGAF